MSTNPNDSLVTVSVETRNLLRKQAKKEGRTMKGLLDIIIKNYIKKSEK